MAPSNGHAHSTKGRLPDCFIIPCFVVTNAFEGLEAQFIVCVLYSCVRHFYLQDVNIKHLFLYLKLDQDWFSVHFKIVTFYFVVAIPVFISFVDEPTLVQNVTFYMSKIGYCKK